MRKQYRLYERITIVVDTREQKPYQFEHATIGAALGCGDYSIKGFEDRVAVERKELNDLISCLTKTGRERFERELRRSRALEHFAIVVEANLSDLAAGRYRSDMTPEAVLQSIVTLSVRYGVPVWLCDSRELGQRVTESLLVKYARERCRDFYLLERDAGESKNAA